MRLVVHLLRKDLRALWPYLLLWTGVLAAHLLLPDDGSIETSMRVSQLRNVLQTIQVVLAALLPGLLILQDPVDGTRAFWLTRPISRGSLLASKVLALALVFILLPLAFQLAGMLRGGLGGWPLVAGLAEGGLWVGGISLAFAALASASSSLPRFVLLLAIYSVVAVFAGPTFLSVDPRATGSGSWLELSNSRDLVKMVLLLLLAGTVLVHQWLTRRTVRSLALAAVAVVALTWASVWPWNLLSRPAAPMADDVTFAVEPADDLRCLERGPDPRRVAICGRFTFGGTVTAPELEIVRVFSRLLLPDGNSIDYHGFGQVGRVNSRIIGYAGPDHAVDHDPEPGQAFQTLLHPLRQQYRDYAEAVGTLEIGLVLASFDSRRLGTLPIRQGARYRAGATAVTLEKVAVLPGPTPTVGLELELRGVELIFAPRTWSPRLNLSVEHPTAGRPFYESSSGTYGLRPSLPLPRPRLRSARELQTLRFRTPRAASTSAQDAPSTVEEARRWLDEAEIVLWQRIQTGTYEASLRIDDFRMADYALGDAG